MDESITQQYNEAREAAGDERWEGMIEGSLTTLKKIQDVIDSAETSDQAIDTINAMTQQFAMDVILISISQIGKEARDNNAD